MMSQVDEFNQLRAKMEADLKAKNEAKNNESKNSEIKRDQIQGFQELLAREASSSVVAHTEEYAQVIQEQNHLMESLLDTGVELKKNINNYAAEPKWTGYLKSAMESSLKGIGYGVTIGVVSATAAESGSIAAIATAGGLVISGEATAEIINKSGQMFRVIQRNDIDPLKIAGTNPKTKLPETNLEAMRNGRSPVTNSGEKVQIHHMGQDAFGPFIEVTKTTHKPVLHNQYGYGNKHPTNPVNRAEFNPVREAYWRAYAEQFK